MHPEYRLPVEVLFIPVFRTRNNQTLAFIFLTVTVIPISFVPKPLPTHIAFYLHDVPISLLLLISKCRPAS